MANRWWDGATSGGTGDGASIGGTATWNTTTTNWDQGNALARVAWVNANNDLAIFGGTAGTVTLGVAVQANGLKFDVTDYIVNGSVAVTLAGTTPTIDVASSATATINSLVAGSVAFSKISSGTLVLTGANTYTSAFTISAGIVRATTSASSLGTGAASVTLASGSTLQLANNTALSYSRNTTLSGNATVVSDTTSASAGVTHTMGTLTSGAFTLTVATGANATGGTAGITFGSVTLTGDLTLAVASNTTLTLGALQTTARNITKSDAGTLILGTAANIARVAGTAFLNGGTLSVRSTSALGTSATTLSLSSGVLDLRTDTTINAHPTTISGNVTVNSGRATVGAGITHTLGTLSIGSFIYSVSAGANVTSGTASLTHGTSTLTGAAELNVGSGALLTLGALGGNFSITKSGLGQLNLSTTSTRAAGGNTTLNDGTLRIATASALSTLSTATLTMNGGTFLTVADANTTFNGTVTTVSGTAIMSADRATSGAGGITHTIGSLNLGEITLSLTAGPNVTSGQITTSVAGASTLSGNASITTTSARALAYTSSATISNGNYNIAIDGAGSVSFAGIIGNGSGGISLLANHTGIVTLSAANTYSGSTNVYGGTLVLTGSVGTGSIYLGAPSGSATSGITLSTNATPTIYVNAGGTGTRTINLQGTSNTPVVLSSDVTFNGANSFNENITGTGNITVINSATFGVASTTKTINNSGTLTLSGVSNTINSVLGGNLTGITINNGANVTLTSTANTFAGTITINNGTVNLSNASSWSYPVTLSPGTSQTARINLYNGNHSGLITLAGTIDSRTLGMDPNATAAGTFSGGTTGSGTLNLTNTSSFAMNIATGALNHSGAIVTSGQIINISANIGSNVTTISGSANPLTISGSITVNSSGTTLSRSSNSTTISGGIVGTGDFTLFLSNALISTTADTNSWNNTGNVIIYTGSGDMFTLNTSIGPNVTGISYYGNINSNFAQTTSAPTTIGSGAVVTLNATETVNVSGPLGKGLLTFQGGQIVYSATNSHDYSSRVSSASNQTIGVNTLSYNRTWSSNITASSWSLLKLGSGQLTLSGDSANANTITISNGTLRANTNVNALGSAVVAFAASGTLTLTNNISGLIIKGLSGGSATATVANGASGLELQNTSSYTYSGVFTGSGHISMNGPGAQIFNTASASYTGNLYILNGSVTLNASAINNGTIYLGDITGSNNTALFLGASSLSNPINLRSGSTGTKSIIGSGGTYVGTLTVADDLILGAVAGSAFTFTPSAASGTGNITTNISPTASVLTSNIENWTVAGSLTHASSGILYTGLGSSITSVTVNHSAATLLTSSKTISSYAGNFSIQAGTWQTNSFGPNTNGRSVTVSAGAALSFTAGTANTGSNILLTVGGTGTAVGNEAINFNTTGTVTLDSPITITSNTSWYNENTGTATISGVGAITASDFNLTIGTTSTGSIQISKNVNLGTGSITIMSGSSGALGAVYLSGDNSYSGGLNVSQGTVYLDSATAAGTGTITVNNAYLAATTSNTLSTNNPVVLTGTLNTNNGTLDIGTGNVTLGANRTFNISGTKLRIGGSIVGSGFSVTKTGTGILELYGSSTFSGGLSISAGTVLLSAANALPNNTAISFGGGGGATLDIGSQNVTSGTIAFNSTNNSITGSGTISPFSITANANSSGTISTIISGNGGITVGSTASLTLTGLNTFLGSVSITGGLTVNSLADVGVSSALGAPTNSTWGTITFLNDPTGPSLTYTGPATTTNRILSLSDQAKITLNASGTGTVEFTSNIQGTGTTAYKSVNLSGTGSGKFSGVLANVGGGLMVTKSGTGTWELSGDNTYNLSTIIYGGTLLVTGKIWQSSSLQFQGNADSTVDLGGGFRDLPAISFTSTYNTNVYLINGSFSSGGNIAYSATAGATFISANFGGIRSFNIAGAAPLTLSGNNTFNGGINITSAATLNINSPGALGVGSISIGAATTLNNTSGSPVANTGQNAITLGANLTFTGSNDLDLGIGVVTLTATRTITTNGTAKLSFSGWLAGSGFGVTKTGTGILELKSANLYSGPTTVNAGTLLLSGTISSVSAVTVAGGTIDLNGFSNTLGTVTVSSTSGTAFTNGTLTATAVNITNISGTVILSTAFAGSTPVTKTGAGIAVISNSGTTSTGNVTITAGTVRYGDSSSFGTMPVILNAGTLDVATASVASNLFSLNANSTFAGTSTLEMTSSLSQNAARTLTINAGTLKLTNSTSIAGAFAFTKAGAGALELWGNGPTATAINVTAGIFRFGSASALGSTPLAVSASTSLDSAIADLSPSGTINLLGSFTFTGTNNLSLANATVNYTPATAPTVTVTANKLTLPAVNYTTTTLGLTKAGAGTLAFSADPTNTGTVTVSAGTLDVSGREFINTTAVTLAGGKIYNDLLFNGYFGPSITVTGASSLEITKGNDVNRASYLDVTTINLGAFTLTTNDTLADWQTDAVGTIYSQLLNWTGAGTLNLNTKFVAYNATFTTSRLTLNGSGRIEFNEISGTTGGLTLASTFTGTCVVGYNYSASVYSGGVIVNGGTLSIDSRLSGDVGLGTGTLTIAGGTIVNQYGNYLTVTNPITSSGNLTIGALSSSIGFDGNVALSGVSRTFNGPDEAGVDFNGVISGTNNGITIASGVWGFTGLNTYTGATVVNGGVLIIGVNPYTSVAGRMGSTGSAVQMGATLINSNWVGGTINANGNALVNGAFTLNAGGTPGSQVPTLGGGSFQFSSVTLNEASGQNADLLGDIVIVTGAVTHAGSGDVLLGNTELTVGGTVTQSGSGTLYLYGTTNTINGAVNISNGTLKYYGGSVNATTTTITMSGGALGGFGDLNSNLTLTGNPTYNADSVIDQLSVKNVALGATRTITTTVGQLRFDGVVSGTGFGITKSGSGALWLNGTSNTYTGVTTVNAGRLRLSAIGNGGAVSSMGNVSAAASNLIINGGIVEYPDSDTNRNYTIGVNGGGLAGTYGGLSQTLDVAPTFTGTSARRFSLGGLTYSPLLADVSGSANPLTLQIDGGGLTFLSNSNTFTGGVVFTNDFQPGNATDLCLSNVNQINLSNNTLTFDASEALSGLTNITGADLTITRPVTLLRGGRFNTTVSGNTTYNLTFTDATLGSVRSDIGAVAKDVIFPNVISDVGGTGSIRVINGSSSATPPKVVLQAANTFGGGFTVGYNGHVSIDNDSAFGSGSLTLSSKFGSITLLSRNRTITNSVKWDGGLKLSGSYDLTLSGSNALDGYTNEISVPDVGRILDITGTISRGSYSGSRPRLFASSPTGGYVQISSDNSNSDTVIGLMGGNLRLNNANALGSEFYCSSGKFDCLVPISYAGFLTLGGGTFEFVGTNSFLHTSGNGTITSGTIIQVNSGSTFSLHSPISGTTPILTKTGAGTLSMSALHTFSGGVTLNDGTLRIGTSSTTGSGGSLGKGTITFGGGTLETSANITASNPYAFTGTLNYSGSNTFGLSSSHALTASRTVNVVSSTLTLSGTISGTGFGITKTGSGTLAVTGSANTFTGVVAINGGTLRTGTLANGGLNSSLGASAGLAGNLTFDGGTLLGNGSTNRNFTVNGSGATFATNGSTLSLSGSPTLNASANITLTTGSSGTGTYSGVLADTSGFKLGIVKNGTNQWNITSGTSSYTGNVTVNGGVLVASATSTGTHALGSLSAAKTITVNNNGTLSTGVSATFTNTNMVINGFGSTGDNGALQLSGATISFNQGVALGSNALIRCVNGTFHNSSVSLSSFSATISVTTGVSLSQGGVISGSGTLNIGHIATALGTVRITNSNNTHSGPLHLHYGTCEVVGRLQSGSFVGSISVGLNTTLTFNSTQNQTLTGQISGSGSITKQNTGTLTINANSADNTFSGGVSISGGTIVCVTEDPNSTKPFSGTCSVVGGRLTIPTGTNQKARLVGSSTFSINTGTVRFGG